MKPAAIGVRVHSGWGAVVVISRDRGAEQAIDRRRVSVVEGKKLAAVQPFHFAARLELRAAESHIRDCAAKSVHLAVPALRDLVQSLQSHGYRIDCAAILMSSGRPLPELAKILAAHPLIHTAEGEFFRQVFRDALEQLRIPVTGIRERDLSQEAVVVFGMGKAAASLQSRIAAMGKILGPPWTTDQKHAALAAAIALESTRRQSQKKAAVDTSKSFA